MNGLNGAGVYNPYAELMKGFNSIDAATLMDKQLPNSCFLVDGIVPEVVNMISGAPKVGKSWLMLDLELSIASGDMGFIIDESGKHAKIKHAGTERFVRFKLLGEGYSIEEIIRRIYQNNGRATVELPKQDDPKNVFEGEEEPVRIMTYIPLFRSYDRAMKIAKKRPYQNFRVYYLVRQDFSAKRLYENTLDLLVDHNLKTAEDVINYKAEAMDQIDENQSRTTRLNLTRFSKRSRVPIWNSA